MCFLLLRGGLNLQPNFQKGGGLDRNSVFIGGDFFQGVVIFTQKLKSGIFNDKKVYKQECFAIS